MRIPVIATALSIALAASGQQQPPEPSNRSHRLEALTWIEAEPTLTPDAVVVIPVGGASAPHGPHLPLRTDAILAQHLTERVAAATPVVLAPLLTYGHHPALLQYPGATSLSSSVVRDVAADIARSVARHGPRRFYAISAAPADGVPLAAASRLLRTEGILLEYADVSAHLEPVAAAIRQQRNGDHAGEMETSMMLHVDERLVDMSKAARDDSPESTPFVLTRVPNRRGTYSPSGVWGDATLATPEKGRVLVEALVNGVLRDIAALRAAALPRPRMPTGVSASRRSRVERDEPAGLDPTSPDSCSEGDQREIRELGDRFTTFWRNKDAVRLAGLWAELGDIRHPDNSVERMREVIMVNRMDLFRQKEYRASRHTLQVGVIRCLSDDIAVADGKWELRDVFDADGQQLAAIKGLFTLVLRRGWFIESYRYTVDPAEPAGPTLLTRPGYPGRGGGPGLR